MNTHYKAIHEQYIIWLNTLGFAKGTVRRYGSGARDFFIWLENRNINHITQITTTRVETYYNYLQIRKNKKCGGTLSNVYLNENFISVDKLLEFLHQTGADDVPSPLNFHIAIDENERMRKIQPFTIEEIKILQSKIEDLYPNSNYEHRTKK